MGTIAFISLQGYSAQSRDSARISDLSTIRTSLELFQLDAGKYPLPTGGENVTYSGGIVWNQGIFGESVFKNVEKLDKIPTDPFGFVWYSGAPTSWANSSIDDNWGDLTNTNVARQGPCGSGYHVPSKAEWEGVVTAGGWCIAGCGGNDDLGNSMATTLNLSKDGYRSGITGGKFEVNSSGRYWTSSNDGIYASRLFFDGDTINYTTSSDRHSGYPVRCFKN